MATTRSMARFEVIVEGTIRLIDGDDILRLQKTLNKKDGEQLLRLVKNCLVKVTRVSLRDYEKP